MNMIFEDRLGLGILPWESVRGSGSAYARLLPRHDVLLYPHFIKDLITNKYI